MIRQQIQIWTVCVEYSESHEKPSISLHTSEDAARDAMIQEARVLCDDDWRPLDGVDGSPITFSFLEGHECIVLPDGYKKMAGVFSLAVQNKHHGGVHCLDIAEQWLTIEEKETL